MATIETNPQLGQQVVEDAKQYRPPLLVGAERPQSDRASRARKGAISGTTRERYLDFASQLVNVSIGHQHPRLVAAIKEQADKLCTIGPPMATEPRSRLRA